MSNSQTRSFITRDSVATFMILCIALSFCVSILSAEEYDLNPGQTLTLGSELNNTANTVNVKGGTLKVDGTTDITANFNYDETSVLTIDLNNSSCNKWITPMSQSLLSSDSRDIYFTNAGNSTAYLHLGTSYEYNNMDYSAYTGTYIAKDGAIFHIEYADHNIDVNLRMESGTTLVIPYKADIYAYRTSNKSIELNNATLQYGSYGNLSANGMNFSGDCTLQSTGGSSSDLELQAPIPTTAIRLPAAEQSHISVPVIRQLTPPLAQLNIQAISLSERVPQQENYLWKATTSSMRVHQLKL